MSQCIAITNRGTRCKFASVGKHKMCKRHARIMLKNEAKKRTMKRAKELKTQAVRKAAKRRLKYNALFAKAQIQLQKKIREKSKKRMKFLVDENVIFDRSYVPVPFASPPYTSPLSSSLRASSKPRKGAKAKRVKKVRFSVPDTADRPILIRSSSLLSEVPETKLSKKTTHSVASQRKKRLKDLARITPDKRAKVYKDSVQDTRLSRSMSAVTESKKSKKGVGSQRVKRGKEIAPVRPDMRTKVYKPQRQSRSLSAAKASKKQKKGAASQRVKRVKEIVPVIPDMRTKVYKQPVPLTYLRSRSATTRPRRPMSAPRSGSTKWVVPEEADTPKTYQDLWCPDAYPQYCEPESSSTYLSGKCVPKGSNCNHTLYHARLSSRSPYYKHCTQNPGKGNKCGSKKRIPKSKRNKR